MEEVWKPIVGWEGLYDVSNLGRIRNAKTKYIRSPNINADGYEWLTLTKYINKKKKLVWFTVHSLVARTFLPNPLGLEEVDHKDRNKTNNVVDNLEWVTRSENQKRVGTDKAKGKRVPVAQYTLEGELVSMYRSAHQAMRITGVNQGGILKCAKGFQHRKTAGGFIWKFVTEEEYEKFFYKK